MRRLELVTTLALLVLASQPAQAAEEPPVAVDITSIVEAQGIDPATSTLVIERRSDGAVWVSNPTRAGERFPPASTSKIPHTLIALETGFATPETRFEWDGVERFFGAWNQDQTLDSAFRYSAVWVYQRITSGLGAETMARWIDDFDYGNQNTGGPDDLTTYWLRGPLEISAREQIDFLSRMLRGQIPLSLATVSTALPLMVADEGPGWILYAKTGWYREPGAMDVGWYVGWVGRVEPAETYFFAFNLDMPEESVRNKRRSVVRSVLTEIGAIPPPRSHASD